MKQLILFLTKGVRYFDLPHIHGLLNSIGAIHQTTEHTGNRIAVTYHLTRSLTEIELQQLAVVFN